MCVRSTAMSSAYSGPQTSTSSARWVISRPRLRASVAQQPELDRREVDLVAVARDRARREVDHEAVVHDRRLAGPSPARRSAACSRATSSRGPNGLMT